MGDNIYRPRFLFEITDEQKERVDRLLNTHGIRKAVFQHILDDVLDMVEEYGGASLGILLSGHTKPREIIPIMKKAEEVGKK